MPYFSEFHSVVIYILREGGTEREGGIAKEIKANRTNEKKKDYGPKRADISKAAVDRYRRRDFAASGGVGPYVLSSAYFSLRGCVNPASWHPWPPVRVSRNLSDVNMHFSVL